MSGVREMAQYKRLVKLISSTTLLLILIIALLICNEYASYKSLESKINNTKEVMQNENSITGAYLSGRRKIEVPEKRRKGNGLYLEIKGASENNLKNINVKFPLGKFICITGVSGSGKSSLINEILYKAVYSNLYKSKIGVSTK